VSARSAHYLECDHLARPHRAAHGSADAWKAGGSYSMNQKTFALLTMMSAQAAGHCLARSEHARLFVNGRPINSLTVYPVQTDRLWRLAECVHAGDAPRGQDDHGFL
jgi:hypothetical protein